MTTPYIPGETPTPPPPAPRPAPRNQRTLLIGLAVAVVVLGGTLVVALLVLTGRDKPAAEQPSAWDLEQAERTTSTAAAQPEPEPEPTSAGPTPAAGDFKLTPKIMDKKCFGSAGCNVTFRLDMDYSGPALSESDTWLITYEVGGIEDAPMIGTLELTGTTFESTEETVSTTSSNKKLTVNVTEVAKEGI